MWCTKKKKNYFFNKNKRLYKILNDLKEILYTYIRISKEKKSNHIGTIAIQFNFSKFTNIEESKKN